MTAEKRIFYQLVSAGFLCAVIIKFVVVFTEPYIAKNADIAEKKALFSLFGLNYPDNRIDEVFSKYIKVIRTETGSVYKYYTDNTLRSIALRIDGMGFWGEISALIALKPDLKTIDGLTIISHNETPGLGAKITEPEFLSKFHNKKFLPEIKIKKEALADNEIDAITGATQTSNALEKIINDDIREYLAQKEKWISQ